jgi:HK97 family phage portal protein
VSLLAGAIGSLPLMVYRRLETGRERATNHWMWSLLHDQPNPAMAADEMWELVAAHLLLWGNAFLLKIADPIYPVGELWPIRPDRIQVGVQDGERFWMLDGKDRLSARDVLHIRGLGTDGVVGLSPIQQARQMLASGMEMEEFTGRFWGGSAMPSGVLTHPNTFKNPVAARRIKEDFLAATTGTRRGSLVVLEEGMKFDQVGLPMADAQFIETAKFNLTQVALLFRVPPKMLAARRATASPTPRRSGRASTSSAGACVAGSCASRGRSPATRTCSSRAAGSTPSS